MALLEAVVVVYVRALLQVTPDRVDLGPYMTMEVGREIATIVMLVAVGCLAGRHKLERWAYGLFAFGLWDIFYYVWLKVLLDWPATLLDWDILFLIPLRWWGPVLSPVLIAVLICVCAVLGVVRMRCASLGITPLHLGLVVLGSLLALYVFMSDALHALLAGQPNWNTIRPSAFRWPLYLLALLLLAWPGLATTWPWQGGLLGKARRAAGDAAARSDSRRRDTSRDADRA
jgi:hypothetical protein